MLTKERLNVNVTVLLLNHVIRYPVLLCKFAKLPEVRIFAMCFS